jgi:hypothetical protein
MKQGQIFVVGALVHALVSFVNIWGDYDQLCGSGGLLPDTAIIPSIAADYDIRELLMYWPTLLYFIGAEWVMWIGAAASVVGITMCLSRPLLIPRVCCGIAYVCLLSFSHSRGLMLWFPWDCMLFEVLVLSALCPGSAFARRFLLFRVVFGFGKHKFLGAHEWDDFLYTSSMACWQPLGSSVGWWLVFLPDWVHVVSILMTFAAEMIAPFVVLFSSNRRLVKWSCWSIILLMGMIQISGHFGWFNTLTGFLAMVVMRDMEPAHSPTQKRKQLFNSTIKLIYITLGIVFLIPSQWNSPAMFYQHTFDSPYWEIVRVASSWRILHTYGVFPPKKLPAMKPIGRFELIVEGDDPVVLQYHYQQVTTTPFAPGPMPFSVAPLRFPRFDYVFAFYAGSNVWSMVTRLGPIVSSGDEYIDSVARMIFQGNERVLGNFFSNYNSSLEVNEVVFSVVGLVPDLDTHGWVEVSRDVSKRWTRETVGKAERNAPLPFSYDLPPSSIVLRKKSRSFSRDIRSYGFHQIRYDSPHEWAHAMFNRAVSVVDAKKMEWMSESAWLHSVEEEWDRLTDEPTWSLFDTDCENLAVERNFLWNLCPSMQFGGYLGCLTFVHLVPHVFHSPVCPIVMEANRGMRGEADGGIYSKIPIEPFVYRLMGLDA